MEEIVDFTNLSVKVKDWGEGLTVVPSAATNGPAYIAGLVDEDGKILLIRFNREDFKTPAEVMDQMRGHNDQYGWK